MLTRGRIGTSFTVAIGDMLQSRTPISGESRNDRLGVTTGRCSQFISTEAAHTTRTEEGRKATEVSLIA